MTKIDYRGCFVDVQKQQIVAPNGETYHYELLKTRKWNIGLRRHALQLTGEISVFFPAESRGRIVSVGYYPDWGSACATVAKYSVVDALNT